MSNKKNINLLINILITIQKLILNNNTAFNKNKYHEKDSNNMRNFYRFWFDFFFVQKT